MKRVVMFGSKFWPTCEPAKEFLSENGVKFVYRDITENMMNLKLFLNHRDNNPVFDEIKEGGRVGLPCLFIGNGDQIVFDVESLDIEDLKK